MDRSANRLLELETEQVELGSLLKAARACLDKAPTVLKRLVRELQDEVTHQHHLRENLAGLRAAPIIKFESMRSTLQGLKSCEALICSLKARIKDVEFSIKQAQNSVKLLDRRLCQIKHDLSSYGKVIHAQGRFGAHRNG